MCLGTQGSTFDYLSMNQTFSYTVVHRLYWWFNWESLISIQAVEVPQLSVAYMLYMVCSMEKKNKTGTSGCRGTRNRSQGIYEFMKMDLLKPIIGHGSFSTQKHHVMLSEKTAFYEMSVLMRLSRMAQLSRATCTKWLTHTYKRRQTFLYSFCRKHCVNGDNREAKHSLVLSITHTGSNCAQQKSLTVPFKRQKPKTLQQLLT